MYKGRTAEPAAGLHLSEHVKELVFNVLVLNQGPGSLNPFPCIGQGFFETRSCQAGGLRAQRGKRQTGVRFKGCLIALWIPMIGCL